ncbi:MAG TPA: hypothetical protein VIJ68_00470 [Candidatus Saccharimonadales bacterium]
MEDWPWAPEADALEEMGRADAATIDKLLQEHPPQDTSDSSRSSIGPGDYWGTATAVACLELGLPLGFARDDHPDLQVYGSTEALNYWHHLSGFELRGEGNIPANESRSGIFTILNNPVHQMLFEHMYAARHEFPIETLAMSDPMFWKARDGQPITIHQAIDHQGFLRLYQEDPERCIRLYLARQLPHLGATRKAIQGLHFDADLLESHLAEKPGMTSEEGLIVTGESQRERIQFQRYRAEYFLIDYDFTVRLLSEGYKPYSLKDIIPIAAAYVTSLLAAHPELNPADLQVEIPDARQQIGKLLTDLHRHDKATEN